MDPRSSSGTSAYGSAGASGHFDPAIFIRKPQVILRMVGVLFSIVVFACLASQGWHKGKCFDSVLVSHGVCGYGTAVGVIAFVSLLIFLALDAMFDNVSNIQLRKYIVIADITWFGIMSFLWFVSFCYMAASWRNAVDAAAVKSGVEASITFSFFSTLVFVVLCLLAVMQYRQGVSIGSVHGSGSDSYTDTGASPF